MYDKFLTSPPMGWNSWDCYGAGVTEKELLQNAEYMSKYLKEYGWEYVVCDIQWSEPTARGHNYHNFAELNMDEYSRLIPAENRFPSSKNGVGFKEIADKIHAMGLKFGIHIMRGIPRQAVHRNTPIMASGITARDIAAQFSVCPWNTDMYGVDTDKKGAQEYYDSLFSLYASWGVDYIKCDDISNTEFKPHEPYSASGEIELIRNAINNCGRKMVLSLSPGPAPVTKHEHLYNNADMWRMSGDFWDKWDKLLEMFRLCKAWAPYKKPGSYPDCDMLPLGHLSIGDDFNSGNGRLTQFTKDEQITMMTLWSIFGSPLMMGGEMNDNDAFTLALLTNKDIIEMDKTSTEPKEELCDNEKIMWTANGESCKYLAVFNISESVIETAVDINAVALTDAKNAYDLWQGENIAIKGGKITLRIQPHGAKAIKIF